MASIHGPFNTVSVCSYGQRIELAPHLDHWMMGDRYGDVVGFVRHGTEAGTGKERWFVCRPEYASAVRVKLDVSGKTITIKADGIGKLI